MITRERGIVSRLSAARWTAITAIFVNLGIHLALAPMHIHEMLYIGVLVFIVCAVASLTTAPRRPPCPRLVAWMPWHDRTAPLG